MSDGGKGSKPRPYSISQQQFIDNWNLAFARKNNNTGTDKSEYYDILSTEDCFSDDIEEQHE